MSKVLVLGGGFAGVVAAESLAKSAGEKQHISLISRSREFLFYPALVRFALGQCIASDLIFDLRKAMLSRDVNFVEAEVARIIPETKSVMIAGGDLTGQMPYDFLVLALGRRL